MARDNNIKNLGEGICIRLPGFLRPVA